MKVKPLEFELTEKLLDRFLAKVQFTETCWLWQAGLNIWGYGKFRVGKRTVGAHLVAYYLFRGSPPEGDIELDHTCRVRNCVHPWHLDPVSSRTNVLRGEGRAAFNAKKTICPKGHLLEGENLYLRPDGARSCKECKRQTYRVRYWENPDRARERARLGMQRHRDTMKERKSG